MFQTRWKDYQGFALALNVVVFDLNCVFLSGAMMVGSE